jgi:hypothetical protein
VLPSFELLNKTYAFSDLNIVHKALWLRQSRSVPSSSSSLRQREAIVKEKVHSAQMTRAVLYLDSRFFYGNEMRGPAWL